MSVGMFCGSPQVTSGRVMPTPTRTTPKLRSLPSGLRSHIRDDPTAAASVLGAG
ncbi:Uncharacterised protein [Mycobacterium tuberculosis]|nr:Uncharacterised protein [Mycobacterium tuberculosis]